MDIKKQISKDIDKDMDEFISECIKNNSIKFYEKDWMSLKKTIDKYHQVFKYKDEYGYMRYYTLHLYDLTKYIPRCLYPYECVGFWSDKNGNPLCKNNDPVNNGDVFLHGENMDKLYYKSYFELRYKCQYFWNKDKHGSNDEY